MFHHVIQNVCDYKVTPLQMINQEKMQSCSGKYDMFQHNTTFSFNNTVHIYTEGMVQKIFKIMVEIMLLAMYRCGKTPCPDFMR